MHASLAVSLSWMEVAQAVLGGSRSMTHEELTALEDFTWAELRLGEGIEGVRAGGAPGGAEPTPPI